MANSIHEMIRASFRCEDMVKCVLGLKSLDIEAYKALLNHGPLTAEQLGDLLHRERSTAYRALQNLITCGLVYRETMSIESGGYYYEYVGIKPDELKTIVKKNVDEWYGQMNELIEKMDDKMNALIIKMDEEKVSPEEKY
ncbi:MAG: helix-turn-helix domain-containing protein [Methanosarcinaceae archaeon]|nr:helix-turn-helix domain-containing protein [Methanosarcinaceae archaeon]MDD4498488.1 helix-turn-helix domain-containing protein [Methanosarcinaceae archaeon]